MSDLSELNDLERELRALPRPEPSPELDERIERLQATSPRREFETASMARRRTLALVRSAALLLVGLLLGRATAPPAQSDLTPGTSGTEVLIPAEMIESDPVVEPGESVNPSRDDDEPPLFAAANARQLLARAPTAERGPPLFVPPQDVHNVLELVPTPSHE